jgi:transcriptional regulator with XRE-family HTH domain
MKGRALVAWNLRRIRVRRGLSQERLAFDAGVDRSYVGGLERQEENPTVDVLDRLAKTLAVHVSELFAEPAKGSSPPEPLKRGRRPSRQSRGYRSTTSRETSRAVKSSRGDLLKDA